MGEAAKRKCTKKFRLALWWLTYRLYVLEDVNSEAEKAARKHCKYTGEDWSRDRADFQQQWARMLAKRRRRFEWFQKHGNVPDGWGLPQIQTIPTRESIPREPWPPAYRRSTGCLDMHC